MFEVMITGTEDEEEPPGTMVGASRDRVTRLMIFIMLTTFG